ncbi:MAG: DUF2752 domain-containing protein [Ruminococcaceae bacterium]|nr:DUF2752 domain-containing protein [Oscillospiraceae bacterium]
MNRTSALLSRLLVLTLGFFLLTILPTDLVERGSLCLIYHITGLRCPMCGMTRAFSNVLHGNFARAMDFNPLVVVMFPLLALQLLDDLAALLSLMRGGNYRSVLERIWYRIEKPPRRK